MIWRLQIIIEILIIFSSSGIGLQYLIEAFLAAVLADSIGLPRPNHDVKNPVKDNNNKVAER